MRARSQEAYRRMASGRNGDEAATLWAKRCKGALRPFAHSPFRLAPPRLARMTHRYDFVESAKIAVSLDGEAQGTLGPH
jgi:hypothetical protein